MLKHIVIIFFALITCSFKGSAPTTEFYFFELEPTKADMTYYFSQIIKIQYTDYKSLESQKNKYVRELKAEAVHDKLDSADYSGYVSAPSDNQTHCENLENAAQATLTAASKKFINRDIHQ